MAELRSELYFRVAFISLLLSLASGYCVDLDLGMENGTILDSKITASSVQSANTPAKNGRLNYTLGSSWCAGTSASNSYLQIDLQTLHIICAVSTQGNSQADQWVKTYTLKLSKDGSSWTDYKEDGQVKIFEGNNDRNSEVRHILYRVLTRYLRFLPKTHQGQVCMRTEVFGVKIKPENLALRKATAQSSTYNYSSTVTGVSGNAVDGNPDTDFKNGHCSHTNAANPSWWRVDPGENLMPVSEIFIVNRFSSSSSLQQRNEDYKITLGSSQDVTKNYVCDGKYSFVDFAASAVCFTNPLKTGRYVGIMTTKSQILQLCEVEVYSRENLAFGKPTDQEYSKYNDGRSSKAVDGNSNTDFMGGAVKGSCTMTKRKVDVAPWWRVDLQQVQHVSEVYIVSRGSDCGDNCLGRFQNFEITVGMVGNCQSSANPKCGDTYIYQFPVGEGRSFFCHPSLKGRYVIIRFVDKDKPLTLCEVEVYSERRACPMQAIGVASSDAFPDNRFSASSTSGSNRAFKGRLNGDSAWLPSDNNNANDYLQIDLGYEFVICAVATQGNPSADHWTTKYKLQLSLIKLANNWPTYQENGIDKVFNGNSGKDDIVKHSLREYASGRFIRFQPTTYNQHKALRVEVFGILISAVPSQAPSGFTVTARTSTSITASWQLPPEYARHGTITGFKLFYAKKSSQVSPTVLTNNVTSLSRVVSALDEYTEYEFQLLAFTSKGDGPKSSLVVKRTKEDAPGAPASLTHTVLKPDMPNGPRIKLTWQKPVEPNGLIRSYTLSYSHSGITQKEISRIDAITYTVDVLGGVQYQFYVGAVTIKPGLKASLNVKVPEYKPSVGPANVSFVGYNKTTFNISWAPLTREKSYGKVILYDVKQELLSRRKRGQRSPSNSRTLITTATFVVLYDLPLCSQYNVFVRAYTSAGPGPYTKPRVLKTSKPEAPTDLKATNSGSNDVTLEWTKPKVTTKEGLNYIVKYFGTKLYNKTFKDTGDRNVGKSTIYTVAGLVPGTNYQFQVYGKSVCGESFPIESNGETKVAAPIAPAVGNVTDVTVLGSVAGIYLWPVEQRNGPISAYQVIVLKVVDGVEDLPDDYDSRLNSNDPNKDNLNFYITTEISNVPVYEKSWEFTVGDETKRGGFLNKPLEKGKQYVIFQRAVTRDKDGIFAGLPSKVAKISITPKDPGATDESGSPDAVAIAVPVVLLLLIIPAVVVTVLWYRRRKQSEPNRDRSRMTPAELDDLKNDSPDLTPSTSNLVYQNVAQLQQPRKAADKEVPPLEEKEAFYSEAEDGNPKPIPVTEFLRYFKRKSENGAIVLREEFKNLPGGMHFPWEIGKNNRAKNRYGNIVSYDHSRVVLEKIEGDPKSDYINASYIPTFDEVTMCYIATQGPTASSINDFWRMMWQENCLTIVMLTNLVEQGKVKCDQYWPDNTTKYGSITVTLHKTENFADYVVRTLILVKNSEKREVHQFNYVTWPDKGVPQHSTALLGFRSKIHARHQATGGPLVVHCSAGVGRTGTFIAIDAILEGAKDNKSVFIQNYVQVMRRCRPYMVQKDGQYVFLHQAVMEALVGGDTEIAPNDLRITMTKLAKKNGYAREFKRLELVTDVEAKPEEAAAGFKPSNIDKNRFPNVVPLDIARVFLKSSDPDKNYVNASFVDDYRLRNAYILTQAPLDNTVEDFWRMISQYDIDTVVMLNSLREGKERYPQYWPAEGSQVKYGDITIQTLSENTSDKITTRKFSVSNAEPPKKTSTVNHMQFTGWANSHSCPDTREILELLTAIQHSQQQTGNGVIVFQCSDGVGRSGCVSTIMSVIERVKSEQTVDVFQTVKLIRAKRPGAVLTLEQYMFCYQTILAYLDSFNTYANFSDC